MKLLVLKKPNRNDISKLLKDATVLAKDKNYDEAISILLKAYELMKVVETEWGIKTYFRVARYHHLAGRYEDALSWLKFLYDDVDNKANDREKLYKEWGWFNENGNLKIPLRLRNTFREIILEEINLLNYRQEKILNKEAKARMK